MAIERNYRKDNLFPSLLDRLTDKEPNKLKEAAEQRKMNLSEYKNVILRDLLWLLNTTKPTLDLSGRSESDKLEESTINYGILSLSGSLFSEINWAEVEGDIRQSIINFEPRIEKHGLEVRCLSDNNIDTYNQLVIEVRGLLKLNPYPQEFLFRSSLDLETGSFSIVSGEGF